MTDAVYQTSVAVRMNQSATPSTLIRGWRRSLRTEAWYRRRNGWTAVVVVADNGYRVILRRTSVSVIVY